MNAQRKGAAGRLRPQFETNNRRLSRALARHKARLFYAVLPAGAGREKVGLDDYLLQNTAADRHPELFAPEEGRNA